MVKKIILSVPLETFENEEELKIAIQKYADFNSNFEYIIHRKSIDARSRDIKVNLDLSIFQANNRPIAPSIVINYPNVSDSKSVIIVGAGPAGMFAALRLIELGLKPIVLERGKDVRERRRDLAAINKNHIVNPESNYCFGEGGAGTYSDGKLYTRSKKRGDIQRILEIFVNHGANPEILIEAHPHIGTNKLPQIVAALRNSIIAAGGEVRFSSKVISFIKDKNSLKGVVLENNEQLMTEAVILATGHSARDIYEICKQSSIDIEAKSFALGVRVEHQQRLIDQLQYHGRERGHSLPAASYSLVTQSKFKNIERGVFSFCMCPGGFIVPSATSPNELVVNGMSPSRRDSKFANSGMVVSVNETDWKDYQDFGALAALEFQKAIEQKAFDQLTLSQKAPQQLIGDFIKKKSSSSFLETSYQPGLRNVNFFDILPTFISESLRDGLSNFDRKIKGFGTNIGQMIGIESRTSSPVRIPRDKVTLEHPSTKGLFPCGEGAGYAGGIMSAAIDGERCAEAIYKILI